MTRVKAYIKEVGARSRLDILFISHVHADHLNGLPQLLDKTGGLAVDTIVLPYFNVIERLIGYAWNAIEDPAAARNQFYREFVAAPVAALSSFGPRQILQVRSAGPGGGGMPGPDDIVPPDGGRDIRGPDGADTDLGWKLVGRGGVATSMPTTTTGVPVYDVPDTTGVALPLPGEHRSYWLLSPFIDPVVSSQQTEFEDILLEVLNEGKPAAKRMTQVFFQDWLCQTANIKKLVTTRVGALKAAYEECAADLNMTSLCLFSGPLPDQNSRIQRLDVQFGRWHTSTTDKISWLATGDAALR